MDRQLRYVVACSSGWPTLKMELARSFKTSVTINIHGVVFQKTWIYVVETSLGRVVALAITTLQTEKILNCNYKFGYAFCNFTLPASDASCFYDPYYFSSHFFFCCCLFFFHCSYIRQDCPLSVSADRSVYSCPLFQASWSCRSRLQCTCCGPLPPLYWACEW